MNEEQDVAAQTWEEILSEPITSVREEGWRALRSLEEVSPRPQHAPVVLQPPETWIIVPRPSQPEEAPSSSSLPPSLSEQLSLTWAARRRRRVAPQEPDTAGWPGQPAPVAETELEAQEPPRPTPVWRRPLEIVSRVLRRAPAVQPDAPARSAGPAAQPEPKEPPPVSPATGAGRRRSAPPAEGREVPARTEAEEGQASPGRPRPPPEPEPRRLPLVLRESPPLAAVEQPPNVQESPGSSRLDALPLIVAPVPEAVQHQSNPVPSAQNTENSAPAEPPHPQIEDRTLAAVIRKAGRLLTGRVTPVGQEPTPPPVATPESGDRVEITPGPSHSEATVDLVHRVAMVAPEPPGEAGYEETVRPPAPPPLPGPPAEEERGEVLSPVLQARMGGLVDLPLHDVRIFRTPAAERLTHAMQADAVTVGADIYVAPGRGNTGTPSGQALLAHELSHVAGQAADAPLPAVAEEQRALRLEHAVQRRELAAPGPSSATSEISWAFPEGAEALGVAGGDGPPRRVNLAAPGAPGGGGRSSAGSPALVARAPENRPRPAEPAAGAPAAGSENATSGENQHRRGEEDEAGLIERAVEGVLRVLRRESTLERERTGSVLLPRMKWE